MFLVSDSEAGFFTFGDSLSGRGSAIELNEPPPLAPKQNGDG